MKMPDIFARCQPHLESIDRFPLESPISNFMETHSVEDAMIHADRRTDVTNLIGLFLHYTNAPNKFVSPYTNTGINKCISIAPTTYSTEDKLLPIYNINFKKLQSLIISLTKHLNEPMELATMRHHEKLKLNSSLQ